ncbi:MAG: hypothetical protein AAF360_15090 [Pseudomonadota bacterium]
MKQILAAALLPAVLYAAPPAIAGEADVLKASAARTSGGWTFRVTVAHADAGWDHYADAWRVVGPSGEEYGVRTLLHPHENEQPFTRSLAGVSIPDGVYVVTIEARDSVHGWGGAKVEVTLPR